MLKIIQFCVGIFLLPLNLSAMAGEPLPPEQAFPLEIACDKSNPTKPEIVINWNLKPGYQIYKDKFNVLIDGVKSDKTSHHYSAVFKKQDHDGRDLEVLMFSGKMHLPVVNKSTVMVETHLQGCLEHSMCYPPQVVHRKLSC